MTDNSRRSWLALSALCLGFFMILLDTTIVNVAIPRMIEDLQASLSDIIWVNSVYLLTYATPLLVSGRLGDRFGPRRIFLLGLVLFTLSSLACGLSNSVEALIAARAVQGLGAAAMTPQTMAFITHLFPPSKRGAPMGMWGAVAGVATITGPLLGGVLVDGLGWEWIFFVNVPVGVIAVVMTLALVPNWRPAHAHKFDPLGIFLFCVGLCALVFGLQEGQRFDWGSVWGPVTIPMLIGGGAVLLVLFVLWQRVNRAEPLLPLQIFRHWNFSLSNIAGLCVGFAMVGSFLPLTIYLQDVLGLTPIRAGLLTAPMSLLSGIVAPFAGRLSDRINGKWVAAAGFTLYATGIAVIAWQVSATTSPTSLIPALLVCGVGVGCLFSPLANLATFGLEPRLIGAGAGIFNTSRQVGSVFGSAAIGVLLQARMTVELPAAARTDAAALPPQYRQPFIDAMTEAANSSGEFTGAAQASPPPGVPGQVARQLEALGQTVFAHGFTSATKFSLLLPVAVLFVGVLACMVMTRKRPAAPAPTQSAPSVTVDA
ncbi:efflux MFS transporter permease [Flindersiella endophytica]